MLLNIIRAKWIIHVDRNKLPEKIKSTNANIVHVLIILSLGGYLNAISTGSLWMKKKILGYLWYIYIYIIAIVRGRLHVHANVTFV